MLSQKCNHLPEGQVVQEDLLIQPLPFDHQKRHSLWLNVKLEAVKGKM